MVYYFTSNVVDPPAFIYVGKDKVENEDLIAHGWPEDVWFHADNLSSAHIYLRLPNPEKEPWTAIPQDLLTDCAQLTKANSIEGNKKDNVTIVYTPWSNLKKSGDMATGQVGFHQQKLVKKIRVEKRENAIVNRLNKTKTEKYPDLREERAARDAEERKKERMSAQEKKKEDARIAEERAQIKYQKEHMYDDLHTDENLAMSSNQDRDANFEDDFM
ncbi:Coiled-coil domain-containing protein 25 [Saxophila tyrrhenica]|uniref:Coiled-coil domain-containing protein 25 n=1 Tax=Saxophila tyrrhenica TaxID=1690608 RepID=A0AAV9P8V7_9PEZI|nr:Coiled-coil domain-containing protein 25 [Saxophila tyrrhenica]